MVIATSDTSMFEGLTREEMRTVDSLEFIYAACAQGMPAVLVQRIRAAVLEEGYPWVGEDEGPRLFLVPKPNAVRLDDDTPLTASQVAGAVSMELLERACERGLPDELVDRIKQAIALEGF